MTSSGENDHWIARIAGSLIVFLVTFLLLRAWSLWELGIVARFALAAALGIVFFIFVGSLWRWIEAIWHWS